MIFDCVNKEAFSECFLDWETPIIVFFYTSESEEQRRFKEVMEHFFKDNDSQVVVFVDTSKPNMPNPKEYDVDEKSVLCVFENGKISRHYQGKMDAGAAKFCGLSERELAGSYYELGCLHYREAEKTLNLPLLSFLFISKEEIRKAKKVRAKGLNYLGKAAALGSNKARLGLANILIEKGYKQNAAKYLIRVIEATRYGDAEQTAAKKFLERCRSSKVMVNLYVTEEKDIIPVGLSIQNN